MSTILVTGANGQLGNEMRNMSLLDDANKYIFTDVRELDITDLVAVQKFLSENAVDFIVNCAAYTAVDKAESEIELCRKINAFAVENLAKASASVGAKMIHVSTDYVYSGTHYMPYVETDAVAPASVYGVTKLDGEQLLLAANPNSVILRTSWLYSPYGNNFVKTMLRLGRERESLSVVSDQVGTPTYAADLAAAIVVIINNGEFVPGIYNFSDEGVQLVRLYGNDTSHSRYRYLPCSAYRYGRLSLGGHAAFLQCDEQEKDKKHLPCGDTSLGGKFAEVYRHIAESKLKTTDTT